MPGKRRIRAVSLDPELDDMLVALAAAEMGENVSKMIRKLLRDHLGMNEADVSGVSSVVAPRPVKGRQTAPKVSPPPPAARVPDPPPPSRPSFVEPEEPDEPSQSRSKKSVASEAQRLRQMRALKR